MPLRHRSRLPALIGAALVAGTLAAATRPPDEREVPPFDGWITDLAELLDAGEERDLEALMASYQQGSGHDIALLTVPSLDGEPIEDFARRVARDWKLGTVEENDGALLVVARDDRELRIEVGRGLEGTLTDAICGRIIRDVITPRFQEGDFFGGLQLGIEALHRAAGGDYAALPAETPAASSKGAGFLALVVLVLLLVMISAARRGGGPGGRRAGGSVWPWILLGQALGSGSGSDRGAFSLGGGGRGGFGGGGFGGFGGGGGFSGGGASGRW